ncbi:Gag-pol polyprotein [Camponotus japonicus]
MSTFTSNIEKQNDLFGRITRAFENAKKLGSDKMNRFTLDARIQSLDHNWERFQNNHEKLVGAITEKTRPLTSPTISMRNAKKPTSSQDLVSCSCVKFYLITPMLLQIAVAQVTTRTLARVVHCQRSAYPNSLQIITNDHLFATYFIPWLDQIQTFPPSKNYTI